MYVYNYVYATIVTYFGLQVFSIAVLVTGIVATLAINKVEDYFNDNGSDYKHADSYRKAARWLIFVAAMGVLFHFLMIFIRYLYMVSCVQSFFSIYAYLVSDYYVCIYVSDPA